MVPSISKATLMWNERLLPFSDLKQGSLSADSTTRTSYALPQQTLHHPSTSPLYLSLIMELQKSGSSSGAGYRRCSRDKTLHRDPQAMQSPRPFSKAMP
eukprot:3430208-Ditylum_brightwellii.AAC.1